MASAAPNEPNRNGPPEPYLLRHSPQIALMRATSLAAPASRARNFSGRAMFIGRWRRSETNPACISDAIARACARAAGCAGHNPAAGNFSARYSRIASDSHTHMSPSPSTGTRPEPPNSITRVLKIGSVKRDHCLLERDARDLHRQPWSKRPGRVIFIADEQMQRHHVSQGGLSAGQAPLNKISLKSVAMQPDQKSGSD